jgi:epoxyqueuosine reductase
LAGTISPGFINMKNPVPLTRTDLTDLIRIKSKEIGFSLCGITPAVTPTGFSDLKKWLDQGHAGEMYYIENRLDAYEDPKKVMEGVKSIIVLASNYSSNEHPPLEKNEGRISRYAWGELDYHDVIKKELKNIAEVIHSHHPECKTRGVVDSAPILERDFAQKAGLGWFGKNTMLINKQEGSWFFLSAILTDFELDYDNPHETSHCGTCTKCLEVCPTDAFEAPYELNARKCISYLTIELKKQVPIDLRKGVSDWLFGCDLCQDVCPWNHKTPENRETLFDTSNPLTTINACELLEMDEETFRKFFGKTPLSRPKRAGILRNAAIVLGNRGQHDSVPILISSMNDEEPLIRGASAWALGEIATSEAFHALEARLHLENDLEVQSEISQAISYIQKQNR